MREALLIWLSAGIVLFIGAMNAVLMRYMLRMLRVIRKLLKSGIALNTEALALMHYGQSRGREQALNDFAKGQWDFVDAPISLGNGEDYSGWYIVGSPERAIGLIRHKEDARLIAAAPAMYELLKVWVNVQAQPTLREAQARARQLLSRIDGDADVEAQESAP